MADGSEPETRARKVSTFRKIAFRNSVFDEAIIIEGYLKKYSHGVFKRWQERAGFDRTFNFHALRHTACTNLYRASRDIRLTQRFARHKTITSTAIYTHPTDEDLIRSLQQLTC